MSTDQKPSYIVTDPDSSAPPPDDEPMTEKQAVILRELCEKLDEPMDSKLTRARADERIAALRERLEERGG